MAISKRIRKKQISRAFAQSVSSMTRVELEDELKKWVDRSREAERLLRRMTDENNGNVVQLASSNMFLMAMVDTLNNFAPLSAVKINKDHAFELFNTKELEFSQDDECADVVYVTLLDKPDVGGIETVESDPCDVVETSKPS